MSHLPSTIRSWVKKEELDTKTKVRFRSLADEIESLERKLDKNANAQKLARVFALCKSVDTDTNEPQQAWLVGEILAVLDDPEASRA